jgi:hypothetical protein
MMEIRAVVVAAFEKKLFPVKTRQNLARTGRQRYIPVHCTVGANRQN